MTLANLQKRVAQKLGYWDYTTAAIPTTKDIRVADITDALNDKYDEVYAEYSEINPEFFETEATATTYAATGTISSITSTTLVATTAIFTSDMTDGIVLNSTQDDTEKIATYSSTTQVTLDSAPSGWEAGDTIYVFTGIYNFGGDLTDLYGNPLWVGIKYKSTDDDYRRCVMYGDSMVFRSRRGRDTDDTFSQASPIYTVTKVTVSSAPVQAIKIKPIPEEVVSGGVYIKYNQKPTNPDGTDTTVSYWLPAGHHKLLSDGAIAELCYGHLDDPEKGDKYQMRYEKGLQQLLDSVVSSDEVHRVSLDTRLSYFRNRTH